MQPQAPEAVPAVALGSLRLLPPALRRAPAGEALQVRAAAQLAGAQRDAAGEDPQGEGPLLQLPAAIPDDRHSTPRLRPSSRVGELRGGPATRLLRALREDEVRPPPLVSPRPLPLAGASAAQRRRRLQEGQDYGQRLAPGAARPEHPRRCAGTLRPTASGGGWREVWAARPHGLHRGQGGVAAGVRTGGRGRRGPGGGAALPRRQRRRG
mmetsp:Transcript_71372/g.212911  ORF Transcript_71372/g.212911 Transcript_71372/m.212911 type:complete len:210 (-) Transcript_71372:116-745(-)